MLFIGFFLALFFSIYVQNSKLSRFWLVISSLWLFLLGKEMSWVFEFFPHRTIKFFSSEAAFLHIHELPYGQAVHAILAIILIGDIIIFFKYYLVSFIIQLWQNRKFPKIEFTVVIIAIILATCSERCLFTLPGGRNIVFEEYTWGIVYLGLFAVQSNIFGSTQKLRSTLSKFNY